MKKSVLHSCIGLILLAGMLMSCAPQKHLESEVIKAMKDYARTELNEPKVTFVRIALMDTVSNLMIANEIEKAYLHDKREYFKLSDTLSAKIHSVYNDYQPQAAIIRKYTQQQRDKIFKPFLEVVREEEALQNGQRTIDRGTNAKEFQLLKVLKSMQDKYQQEAPQYKYLVTIRTNNQQLDHKVYLNSQSHQIKIYPGDTDRTSYSREATLISNLYLQLQSYYQHLSQIKQKHLDTVLKCIEQILAVEPKAEIRDF